MGYKDGQTGYPKDVLASRAVVRRGSFALLPTTGLVKNSIPGFKDCDVTILSSPKIGASFVDYVVTVAPGGGHAPGFGGEGIEVFLYVLDGTLDTRAGEQTRHLGAGGFAYCPPGEKMRFKNTGATAAHLFLYKRRFRPAEGIEPPEALFGNTGDVCAAPYEEMENVLIQDLLPKGPSYDMNIHILTFRPGASHGYVETHVQEHGALILTGQGMYNLDNNWLPVKKGDYIFMGAYSLQAGYGVGSEDFSYIYSKDCNRDEDI